MPAVYVRILCNARMSRLAVQMTYCLNLFLVKQLLWTNCLGDARLLVSVLYKASQLLFVVSRNCPCQVVSPLIFCLPFTPFLQKTLSLIKGKTRAVWQAGADRTAGIRTGHATFNLVVTNTWPQHSRQQQASKSEVCSSFKERGATDRGGSMSQAMWTLGNMTRRHIRLLHNHE